MKHIDFAVIGGSYAGLSAALQLARARRQVLVVDAGQRRNRFANRHACRIAPGNRGQRIVHVVRAQQVPLHHALRLAIQQHFKARVIGARQSRSPLRTTRAGA